MNVWDSSDKDATIPIFVHLFNFSLLNSITFDVLPQCNGKVVIVFGLSFLIVVDCFKLMSFAPHTTSSWNRYYNILCIENVPCILATFDGDVLFELPPTYNPNGHTSWMQGMDKMYDGHFWCKVKTINIKMISTLLFARQSNWVI
jgi:hypothetical protein